MRNQNHLSNYQIAVKCFRNETDSRTCDRNKPEGRSNRSPDGAGFKAGFTLGCWKCNVKLNHREQESLLIDEDELSIRSTHPCSRAGSDLWILQYSPIKYIVKLITWKSAISNKVLSKLWNNFQLRKIKLMIPR